MRILLAVNFFLLLTLHANCQTHITSAVLWDEDTIKVDQNIIVEEGASLTINSGSVVFFVDQNFIEVYGELYINGVQGDSVIMTAVDSTWVAAGLMTRYYYGWGGIYAYDNGIVKSSYTVFEKIGFSHHPRKSLVVFGSLHNESSQAMEFDHCRFTLKRDPQQAADGVAVQGMDGPVIIRNSIFKNNRGRGSLVYTQNSLQISNTTFSNNDMQGALIHAQALDYSIKSCRFENNKVRLLIYGNATTGNSSIEQNIFMNNLGAISIKGGYSDFFFRNNIYTNNGGQIYFEFGDNVITGNVFKDNWYADPYDFFGNDYDGIVRIEYTGSPGPVFMNNSFIGNRSIALSMWQVNYYTIQNNIFHNNYPIDATLPDEEYLNGTGRTFQYNLMDIPISGTGNRVGNPRLSDEQNGFLISANSPAINNGSSAIANYLLPTDVLGNLRVKEQIDIGAVEFLDSYVALTDINISATAVASANVGEEVASFSTINQFGLDVVTYSLEDENGLNNDYFSIQGNVLMLKKEITTENLLRIKIRAEHTSGAWVDDYYYLTVLPTIVGLDHPVSTMRIVFPNPANNLLYLKEIDPGVTYTIYSISGIPIKSGFVDAGVLDVGELPDGIYILQLLEDNRLERIKFNKYSR